MTDLKESPPENPTSGRLRKLGTYLSDRVAGFEANAFTRLFVILAIFAFPIQFALDWNGRQDQREIEAWTLLTTAALGNSGKVEAIQFLAGKGVNLTGIDLSCEIMRGLPPGQNCDGRTYLRGLDLAEVEADLTDAILTQTDLRDAQLQGISAFSTDFSRAVAWRANFEAASMNGAVFVQAELNAASFKGANLEGADFSGAVISPFGGLLTPSAFQEANVTGADFTDTDFEVRNAFFAKGYEPLGLTSDGNRKHRLFECGTSGSMPYNLDMIERSCTLLDGFNSPDFP